MMLGHWDGENRKMKRVSGSVQGIGQATIQEFLNDLFRSLHFNPYGAKEWDDHTGILQRKEDGKY